MTLFKTYTAASAPPNVLALVNHLVPRLIAGEHPALASLRAQSCQAVIAEIEMTGVGFYAHFEIPTEVPLAIPPDFEGGSAEIVLEGAIFGAGCVLFVRDGRLDFLEGYTYGDDKWAENASVLSVKNVAPIVPNSRA